MPHKSKNTFDISGDVIFIHHPEWNFVATATIREDYKEEFQSVTWSKNGGYLYSSKLKEYLHIYIIKKWYGVEVYEQMKKDGYVIDHMDNNGFNCCIDNLFFLMENENIAKGHTVDKYSEEKAHIALTLCRDFETQLFQITIAFNYPAIAKISTLDDPALIDIAFLLYNRDYPEVINDARTILYDYKRDYTFEPEKLHFADYSIEGAFSPPVSKEAYDRYIKGGHGHSVSYICRQSPILGWRVEDKKHSFILRGKPNTK